MTFCRQPHARTPFARIVHALLLLAWLVSSQGVAPAFVLAAANMDGDHAVKVGAASNGDLTVVLAHGAAPVREHAPLCALIVAFADTSPQEHADHILSFKSVEDASHRVIEDVVQFELAETVLLQTLKITALHAPVAFKSAPAWSPGLDLKAAKTILLC